MTFWPPRTRVGFTIYGKVEEFALFVGVICSQNISSLVAGFLLSVEGLLGVFVTCGLLN